MNSNPLTNRQLPHEEAIRLFLQALNAGPQPKKHEPKIYRPATDQLVSKEAADELACWFKK